jgi:hypothetical protein
MSNSNSIINVGDTVRVTESKFVAKKYWGMSFTVAKVSKKHTWLLNPAQPAKNLWPLNEEVVKVDGEPSGPPAPLKTPQYIRNYVPMPKI